MPKIYEVPKTPVLNVISLVFILGLLFAISSRLFMLIPLLYNNVQCTSSLLNDLHKIIIMISKNGIIFVILNSHNIAIFFKIAKILFIFLYVQMYNIQSIIWNSHFYD